MKKIVAIITITLSISLTVNAQDAHEIFNSYVEKTGVKTFDENYDDAPYILEAAVEMGPAVVPFKVISDGEDHYRAEMDVQGNNILIIMRDDVGYVTAGGATQKIEDEAQLEQLLPIKNIVDEFVPELDDEDELTYVGKDGKGKKECDILKLVSVEDSVAKTTMLYINTTTKLLDKMTVAVGEEKEVVVTFTKYTEFADGVLLIPSVVNAKSPEGSMVTRITKFEVDYPVAPWMFAAPKM